MKTFIFSIFCIASLSAATPTQSNEYTRKYDALDTVINFCFCTYPYLVIRMVQDKPKYNLLSKIPLKGVKALCAATFALREYMHNRYLFKN